MANAVKDYKTYPEQIQLLSSRGLTIEDAAAAEDFLKTQNYYRLSAYSIPLRNGDVFHPGTKFSDIVDRYNFDALFRFLVFDYGLQAEIAARSYIAHYHSREHGPVGYKDFANFSNQYSHQTFLDELNKNISRSNEPFVVHHRSNKNNIFPLWVAVEEVTFGCLSKFYKNMLSKDKRGIAKEYYGLPYIYIENYMQCSSVARNIAAHGGRFFLRTNLSPRARYPQKMAAIQNDTPFAYLYAIYFLLPKEARKKLISDIEQLFNAHGFIQLKEYGFPQNWQQYFT